MQDRWLSTAQYRPYLEELMHRLRIALIIAAPFALGIVPAAAQDSTASPTPLGEPLPPVECVVEPITYQGLVDLVATPAVTEEPTTESEATPTPLALPPGESADDETVAAVQQTVQEITACLNAGELKRVLSLYSDGFLQEQFQGASFTEEEFEAELGNVTPREEGQEILIYSFGDVVIADDGRAAVIVVGDDQSNERPASGTLFYLVQDGDRWLIDETVRSSPDGTVEGE
jgi:hypothetical protein